MKIGLGLYRKMLNESHYRFARQLGVSHVVAHLEDYFSDNPQLANDRDMSWGTSQTGDWTYETFRTLIDDLGRHDLQLAAVENFAVRHWHDVLLDGPRRDEQMATLKSIVRAAAAAGVPCIGYNFSAVGVWGWTRGPYARGGAMSVGFDIDRIDPQEPMPEGMAWNMAYRDTLGPGTVAPISAAQIWDRYRRFLAEMIPVAEEAGITLAAHPDDPPVEALRLSAKLINSHDAYRRAFALAPSPANKAELCLGCLQEMADGDIYRTVAEFARQDRIGYIHFRNVRGKVPNYHEVFIDEGDIDMARIVDILAENGYDGVLIPDHTPELECGAPWHAGKAYAIGYMKALIAGAKRQGDGHGG
ncbi:MULTISPECIES: mannonate dehydratase [unclassified Roseitalea]|uniref:mannonate dehydratase n=1 Tax=unclassified Roseitalea TaxID=2639107 RepID=UPI00273F7B1B|nr:MULTISPECIES: mannonate dehydratase [unclassified Roseitalea]